MTEYLNQITNGDSCILLENIPPQSIDLVVTSPPYSSIRTYGVAKSVFNFERTAKILSSRLKDGGIICWIIDDQYVNGGRNLESFKQALYFKEICQLRVHDIIIYQKNNFSHPSSNRYHQTWEQVQVFSKGKPKTFNPIIDRENITAGKIGNLGVNSFTKEDGSKGIRKKKVVEEFGMRHNVWKGLTRGQEEGLKGLKHPAMAPNWLCRDLIKSFSNEQDVVLDPFAGSGTTLVQAKNLKRNFIGFEINKDYCNLAEGYLNA